MHISTFLITMGSSEGREGDRREGKKEWGTDVAGRKPPTAHRHVTLYHTLHLVRGSSQPYMVMPIMLVADVKHCRKIRGSPAAP